MIQDILFGFVLGTLALACLKAAMEDDGYEEDSCDADYD